MAREWLGDEERAALKRGRFWRRVETWVVALAMALTAGSILSAWFG